MPTLVFGGVFVFLAMIAFLIVFIIYYVKWVNLNTCKDVPDNCSKQNFTQGCTAPTGTRNCTNGICNPGCVSSITPGHDGCMCPPSN